MKNFLMFVLILLTFSRCSFAVKEKTIEEGNNIFRYADFGFYGKIVLGEQFEQKNHPGTSVGQRTYKLQSGSYSGAKKIVISVDDNNRVVLMCFNYAEDYDFEEQVKKYTESIGKPMQHDTGERIEKVTWQDKYTRFELVRKSTGEMYSLLTDLQLKLQ